MGGVGTEIKVQRSHTHTQQASGKKHAVSILISQTESRNMAPVTHHLSLLLSFCGEQREMESGSREDGERMDRGEDRMERRKEDGGWRREEEERMGRGGGGFG